MYLYYAAGGGFGHLARTSAILHSIREPGILSKLRVLASSRLAPLAAGSFPVPVDTLPEHLLNSRRAYYDYLRNYLSAHDFRGIILDTFPWGIVGEWLDVAVDLPRLLIARQLKWKNYQERVCSRRGPMPHHTLVIEPIEPVYQNILKQESQVAYIREPIIHLTGSTPPASSHPSALFPGQDQELPSGRAGWLVVHSGNKEEREMLLEVARKEMKQVRGEPPVLHTLFPERQVFPAGGLYPSYSVIISGAGYNMAAEALLAPPDRRHILLPLERKFDDQKQRMHLLEQGKWCSPGPTGAQKAAQWLTEILDNN